MEWSIVVYGQPNFFSWLIKKILIDTTRKFGLKQVLTVDRANFWLQKDPINLFGQPKNLFARIQRGQPFSPRDVTTIYVAWKFFKFGTLHLRVTRRIPR